MMNMKRFLAFVLSLCMVLTLAPLGSIAAAVQPETETDGSEELSFSTLTDVELNLPQNVEQAGTSADLALEQELVDENGMIEVFIVMEAESIIEEDASAVMDEDTQEKVEELEEAQAEVIAEIEDTVLEGESLEIEYQYTWLVNGVAATIPYGTMAQIAAIDGVAQVVAVPVYQVCADEATTSDASTMTASDGVMIGRENAWAQGYTGQGIKIAIIDTGLDIDHQNFQALAEDVTVTATADSVAAVLDQLNASTRMSGLTVSDVYHSSKVAFAFNYSDDTTDVTHGNDSQGDHGTHVAGIAAANKVDGSAVVGVAPDAQLYVMKVFGAERAGSASDIVAALEDALILGADVVNMSLGVAAGFTASGYDFIDAVYARVAETGTVLSVSAGNSYTSALYNNWGTNQNTTDNPDNGVMGEPAVYSTSFSVASVENWKIQRNCIQVSDGYQMGYVETSASYGLPAIMTLEGEYGVVAVPGYGEEADYAGLDVTGKVVLVSRGSISFPEKLTYASNAGAAACIVYNNTSGEIYMDLTDTEGTIPCVSITMADGAYLIAAAEADADVTVSFPTEPVSIPSAEAYQMSEFSSWGVAPNLSLEPDITAPGGNIYSTTDGGTYGLMSGTSMAAPNVSGMSAVVMQYVKENFPDQDYRTMVQNLLMSTSEPLNYDEELYYSPRSQGSGLANAFNSVTTGAYLTMEGNEAPEAELGDDANRNGVYTYTFTVHNFGDSDAYYTLDTVAQSEGVTTYDVYEDTYFMSSTPVALSAATGESTDSMVLTHDVDDNGLADSHDAYLIYQAATGNGEEGWNDVEFRYDTDCDDAVSTADVQAYLDALVGNDSDADLDAQVMQVAAGATADVTVTVTLSGEDKTYLDTYYTNGGYVEGYTFLTAMNNGGVDLSLPYMAFYGSWDDAPILDDGYYWDYFNAADGEIVGNQYISVLFTNFYGLDSYYYPGVNVYLDEPVDPAHISVSPDGDGYFDTVDDIYVSLMRNAETLTYRFSNQETGEVYYELEISKVAKTIYSTYYGQIVPDVYSWYADQVDLWDWTDEGEALENDTVVLLEVEAIGAEGNETPDVWSVPVTIDLEAPVLESAVRTVNEDGTVSLTLDFKDNHAVSAILLTDMTGEVVYYLEGVEDVAEDADGYQNHTVTYDITGLEGKMMIILADYAMNQSAYGLNLGGEGASYGDLVAYQYNFETDINGWVSFDANVQSDEVLVFMDEMNVVCAEYVGGYVFAQTETGALYGFKYEDMLKDTFDLESAYVAQLDNVYQDLAYSYAEGKLYGLYTYEDDGYPTTEINSINLKGEYFDENLWMNMTPYQEDWVLNRGGLYGLTMAIDDAGTVYVLGLNYDWDTEGLTETAHLWSVGMEYDQWSDSWMLGWALSEIGDTGKSMDYLQSMTWDHNSESLIWARFDADGMNLISELYEITVDDEGAVLVEKLGELSGETCALFAPLTEESAAKEAHSNIPEMDPEVPGTPILRDDTVTMNVSGSKKLAYDMDPWYTNYKDVVWFSSDETVVTVDQDGNIYAVGTGSAVVTVANAEDESKFDTVTVEVTALDLKIEGVISAQEAGLGNATGTSTYKFEMEDGIASFATVNQITASEDLNYGLSLATSVMGRGSIWASEWGNTGMIYEIDPDTGAVKDVLMPMDGDMLFGMTYNETLDTFAGIMNMYLYVDLELTHEEEQKVLNSYDEEIHGYTYHKINMLPYLIESNDGFVTGEDGQGASSEIVFCGITTLPGGYYFEDTYKDYLGNWDNSGNTVSYTADQTLLMMDNVGRLWYIDEIIGLSKTDEDEWGNAEYFNEDGTAYITKYGEFRSGVFEMENADGTYNLFNIRCIDETNLTDMFREGSMPRITYHFSDIEYAGDTADGAPMILMSLYDYWNNGTTNELYLYIPGVGTGEWVMDYDTWMSYEVTTPTRLFALGNTGANNIVASIHSAEVTGGVDPVVSDEELAAQMIADLGVNTLSEKIYNQSR